jgi:DNA adenine methylase
MMHSNTIKRPMLRWHGGKWVLAPWIISFFPTHRTYTEIYGGAFSVCLRKPPSYAEVWNDLDDGAYNLMSILRDGRGADLVEMLRLTPFARSEFELSYLPSPDPIESARRLIVRSFMGFGSDGHNVNVKTGFRADSDKSGTTPAHDWGNYPDHLLTVADRIMGRGDGKAVVIEHRPALTVLETHDGPDVLHYIDPPYVPATRSDKSRKSGERYHAYAHELTVQDHEELLHAVCGVKGMVVLSGYPSALYDNALKGWRRVDRAALADGARKRVEVLWLNPAAAARTAAPTLFCDRA